MDVVLISGAPSVSFQIVTFCPSISLGCSEIFMPLANSTTEGNPVPSPEALRDLQKMASSDSVSSKARETP